MSQRTWKPQLLHITILEILERKGSLTDAELYDLIKEPHGEAGFGDLNKALMRLEIQGKIYVSTLTKRNRKVELAKAKKD